MLLDAFLRQCRLQPDAPALQEKDRCLSYSELLQSASSVAAGLQALGIHPGQPVAIHLDRGMTAVTALFGVLLAGGCYIPLDLKNPAQRLAFIVADAQVAAVLGSGSPPAWLDHSLWLDLEHCRAAQPDAVDIAANALAAILYTSGSTGQPRGVALSHHAIAAFADWAARLVNLQAHDRIASSTPFFFDLSTFDLYAVLSSGACVCFMPAEFCLAPARLSIWLQEQAINGWYTVPSLLAFLAYKGNLQQTLLPELRFILFAGEVFPSPALMDLAGKLPGTAMYNLFGPTETNVCCYWPVDSAQLSAGSPIPIGWAAAGCELAIHHANPDDSGELWVRGPALASGYWSEGRLQPILNADGWYATGDCVSLEQDSYRFHGRLGRMLKCSGYRVEPAEIETVVNALPGVKGCVAAGINDAASGQRPALVLVLEATVSTSDITTVPPPWYAFTSPAAATMLIASRTEGRETPNISASSRSGGSLSPGENSPARMELRI